MSPSLNPCKCIESVFIPEDIQTPVYLYYSLDGFYQNHRRYVSSINHDQLRGFNVPDYTIDKTCAPYGTKDGKIYAPCGAIANSFFTDRFVMKFEDSIISIKVSLPLTFVVFRQMCRGL